MIVTFDGPAGSGKSTLAIRIAEAINGYHLNTGTLYRWIGLLAAEQDSLQPQWDPKNFSTVASDNQVQFVYDHREADLHAPKVAEYASKISSDPQIRSLLIPIQQNVPQRPLIVDGRDTGTVIFPHADAKFFVTASIEARAKRRAQQLELVEEHQIKQIQQQIQDRDQRDFRRTIAPLRQPDDAILVDTTDLTIEQAQQFVLKSLPLRD